MHIASRMIYDPTGAFEQICGMIPADMVKPIAQDLATNLAIAAEKHGDDGPYLHRHMIDLSRPLLEPVHQDAWALEVKKGMGIEREDFDSFALMLYGVLGAALEKQGFWDE